MLYVVSSVLRLWPTAVAHCFCIHVYVYVYVCCIRPQVPKMLSALRGQQGDDDDALHNNTTNANTSANEQQHSSKDKKHKDTSATTTTVPLSTGDEQHHTAINGSGGSGIRKRSLSWGNARSSSTSKANTGLSSNSTTTAPTIQVIDATAEQVSTYVGV
jgi:hypothetical protein